MCSPAASPHAFTGERYSGQDGNLPPPLLYGRSIGRALLFRDTGQIHPMVGRHVLHGIARFQVESLAQVLDQAIRTGTVRFVHHEDVGDFHQAGLHGLNGVARFGH